MFEYRQLDPAFQANVPFRVIIPVDVVQAGAAHLRNTAEGVRREYRATGFHDVNIEIRAFVGSQKVHITRLYDVNNALHSLIPRQQNLAFFNFFRVSTLTRLSYEL